MICYIRRKVNFCCCFVQVCHLPDGGQDPLRAAQGLPPPHRHLERHRGLPRERPEHDGGHHLGEQAEAGDPPLLPLHQPQQAAPPGTEHQRGEGGGLVGNFFRRFIFRIFWSSNTGTVTGSAGT